MKGVVKIIIKVLNLLLLTITPYLYIDYTGIHMFAYNNEVYVVADNTQYNNLTGITILFYEQDFEQLEMSYQLVPSDYTTLTPSARDAIFQAIYGTSEGAYYATHYNMYKITGGNTFPPLNGLSLYAYVKLFGDVCTYNTVSWSGGDLQRFLSLQETGFYSGYTQGVLSAENEYSLAYSNGYHVAETEYLAIIDNMTTLHQQQLIETQEYYYDQGHEDGLVEGSPTFFRFGDVIDVVLSAVLIAFATIMNYSFLGIPLYTIFIAAVGLAGISILIKILRNIK